jgi:hypothetical protein
VDDFVFLGYGMPGNRGCGVEGGLMNVRLSTEFARSLMQAQFDGFHNATAGPDIEPVTVTSETDVRTHRFADGSLLILDKYGAPVGIIEASLRWEFRRAAPQVLPPGQLCFPF